MTRETFEKAGLFDTAFFMYYEETDLQKRMSQMGIERIIIDSPKIVHYNGGSSKENAQIEMIFVALKVCSDI